MPTGPKGEKRPADVIGNAVKVMRIATLPIGSPTMSAARTVHSAIRLRWAQQAQTQAAIRPRGRATRPTRRSAFVCKLGG